MNENSISKLQVEHYELSCTMNNYLKKILMFSPADRIANIWENREVIIGYIDILPQIASLFSDEYYIDVAKFLLNEWKIEETKEDMFKNKEIFFSLVEELLAVTERLMSRERDKFKICPCCGNKVRYYPLPDYYQKKNNDYKVLEHVAETLNKEEYLCPCCMASDRDRMIVAFLKDLKLNSNCEGEKLLQFAPANSIENWIEKNCYSLIYHSTDLYMEGVTFISDIQNMSNVPEEHYDYIICSHVLEHVQDDIKAMNELYRILKKDGICIFLVPVVLDVDDIDEEWGLTEEENWKRFGQGDHCRRYSKKGLIERLEDVGFCVNCLGKSYFGEDEFKQAGLSDTSTLYVLTKSEEKIEDIILHRQEKHERKKQNMPMVTVAMSAYNHGQYVEKTINSVLNQTYNNIYFTVVDDASTDNTVEILLKYEDKISEIHLYDINSGEGRAIELIMNAKTKYTALINSDDYWESTKIEKQVAYMEAHPECAACFTWCNEVDEAGNILDNYLFKVENRTQEEWMYRFWQAGNCLAHPSILIRTEIYKELLSENNGVFRQLPDYFMWLKLIQKHKIYVMKECLVNFLWHNSSKSVNVSCASNENVIRDQIETSYIWHYIMKEMDDDFFRKAFKKAMINPDAVAHEDIICEKFFVLYKSPLPGVQDAAIRYYYDMFLDENNYKVIVEKYGFNNKKFHFADTNIGMGKLVLEVIETNQKLAQRNNN